MQLDKQVQDMLEDIINRREGIASMQAQIKDDIKAIAEALGVKAAQINKVITLVEKERAKGGVISQEQEILDVAERVAKR